MIRRGALCGKKILWPTDGLNYCIWYPLQGNDDMGMCFDIAGEDIDDAIALLQELREAEAAVPVESTHE